jgi:hypothetical protein
MRSSKNCIPISRIPCAERFENAFMAMCPTVGISTGATAANIQINTKTLNFGLKYTYHRNQCAKDASLMICYSKVECFFILSTSCVLGNIFLGRVQDVCQQCR